MACILPGVLLLPSRAVVTPLSQFILAGWEAELEMRQFNEVLIFTGAECRPKMEMSSTALFFFLCSFFLFSFFKSETSFNPAPLINYKQTYLSLLLLLPHFILSTTLTWETRINF